ncbi:MAG TPA: metallophosphoesterase [Actinomycetota bacterium]|nr:metallophosphoesterase [Actinomycetota bacterium]
MKRRPPLFVALSVAVGALFGAVRPTAESAAQQIPLEPSASAAPGLSRASSSPEPGLPSRPGRSSEGKAEVLVAAAGDVACDPSDPSFEGGKGRGRYCRQLATAKAISRAGAEAVFVLGDTQYDDATLGKFRRSYDKSWGRLKGITYPAVGNHEYYTNVAAGYFDYFGRRAGKRGLGYYSTDLASWHVVSLNSNCDILSCERGSRQYRWLRHDLRSSEASCDVAIMHHPRFSSGPHGDTRGVLPLWRLLYRAGVDVALAGHDHIYERFAPLRPDGSVDRSAGIRSFVVGTGGAETYWFNKRAGHSQARSADTIGVLFLSLRDGAFDWSFDRVAGKRFSDAGSDRCH